MYEYINWILCPVKLFTARFQFGSRIERKVSRFTYKKLIPSGGGVFEIVLNNDLIFSKKQKHRFPDDGEIVSLIRSNI